MTKWRPLKLDPVQARQQLAEFRDYLNANPQLAEAAVGGFIRDRPEIVASLGSLNASTDTIDRWAPELNMFAKHACDLVVGDSRRCAYTLVELEDANHDSIYKPEPATPYFTDRFNHGFSQIVDWLCLFDSMQNTPDFMDYWGEMRPPQFVGVLVIGRGSSLTPEGRRRMEWRSAKVKVNSYAVQCLTYDDLVARLINKIDIHAGVSDEIEPQ